MFAVIPAMLASCDKSPACRMDESYLRLPCKERPVSDEPFEYAGQVLGPDGKPVAGAAVEVFEQFWFNCQVNRRMDSAVTDADGRFRMTGKPSRRYNNILLIAHSKGFAVSCRHLAPWQGAYCVMTLGEPVSVGGVVIDENYRPVAGATVCPRLDDNWRLFYLCMEGLVPSLTAVTDENGRFRLDNVPAGASADEFFVKADGMATGVVWDDIFEKEDRDDFLLLMEKEAVITGSVVEKKTGRPVAGVAIEATMDTGGFFVGSYSDCLPCPVAVTDGTGRFRIGGLPQGRYDLHAAWPPRQPEKWAIESENVFVETGQVIEDVEISTVPCGVMELKLVSPNGSPAAFRPMYFNLADSGDRYYSNMNKPAPTGNLKTPKSRAKNFVCFKKSGRLFFPFLASFLGYFTFYRGFFLFF